MGARARTAAVVAAILWAAACDGPPPAEAALTPFEQLAKDSLPGDSAAFATLPATLGEFLDIREELAQSDAEHAACRVLPSRHEGEIRRRVRFEHADRSAALLYAVADPATGALTRVEYIRRVPTQGQRGLIWDRERDRTTSTWWTETAWGLSRRVERGDIPRGSPLPRALRALGRQLLLVPCTAGTGEGSATAMP